MGALDSKPIKECTKEEISVAVANLGEPYQAYAGILNGNAVDGRLLDVLGKEEIEETLDDLDIANRLHRRVLLLELSKAKSVGEYAAVAYNFSPSTPPAELVLVQQVTDRCLRGYQQTAALAGVYLVLENGNQLSLDTKIVRRGKVLSEPLNSPLESSICSKVVNDGLNQDYYKLLLPCEIHEFLFEDSSPMTFTGYIFKDELGKRLGMVCMLDHCEPSYLNDDDREAFLRPLALEIEELLRVRKQQVSKQRNSLSLSGSVTTRFQLREESKNEIVLSGRCYRGLK